ncbi:MAG: hypothetical protein PHR45_07640 [Muribaculaceae bacterium]|nr:hypothetical protein [Muribaculaceae bacterium]
MKIKHIFITCIAVGPLLMACKQPQLSKNVIVADTDYVLNDNYYGGAMQWEPNDRDTMSEKQWERLFERVEYMKLGYIRCCIMPYFYCFGYEGAEAKLLWNCDSTQVNAKWYANSRRYMNDLYRLLDFCQKNNIDVLLGEWWKPMNDNWKQTVPVDLPKFTVELDDPKYANQVAEMISYLVKGKKFTCIKQFNLGNEVNLMAGDPNNGYTWEKWKASILNLRGDLDKRGLNNIKIVGPDGGYWGEDTWFNKTLNELDTVVDIIDYHWYINKDWTFTNRVEDETRAFRFFTQLNNPKKTNIWGEMGIRDGHNEKFDQHTLIHQWWYGTFVADALIQTLRSGWSAAAAWGMDDSMHYKDDLDKQKRWGFWNSIAEQKENPEEANIRPWFYTWSLMSRNIPKGSKIIHSGSFRNQNINCVAAITPSGDLTFAISNTADFAQDVTLQIPNVANKPTMCKYVYFENDYPVDKKGFPVAKEKIENIDLINGLNISFPSKGFILLTTIGASKPEIKKNENLLVDYMEGLQRMFDYSKNIGINNFAKHYDSCLENTQQYGFDKVLFDYGTIHPSTNEESAYVTYNLNGMSNFDIAVSGEGSIEGRFKVYGSSDNNTWKEIAVNYPAPELSIYNYCHTNMMPKNELSGMNYLKIEMIPLGWFSNSRIREVRITK